MHAFETTIDEFENEGEAGIWCLLLLLVLIQFGSFIAFGDIELGEEC